MLFKSQSRFSSLVSMLEDWQKIGEILPMSSIKGMIALYFIIKYISLSNSRKFFLQTWNVNREIFNPPDCNFLFYFFKICPGIFEFKNVVSDFSKSRFKIFEPIIIENCAFEDLYKTPHPLFCSGFADINPLEISLVFHVITLQPFR